MLPKFLVVKVPPVVDEEGMGYNLRYPILGEKKLGECEPLSEVFFHADKVGVLFPVNDVNLVRWMGGRPCEFLEEELGPETLVTGLGTPEPCDDPHEVMTWNV